LCGLFPPGAFLVEHIIVNARSLTANAPSEGGRVLTPLWSALGMGLILAPLAVHVVLGVALTVRPHASAPSPYTSSWRALNRVSAYVSLLFIAYHVYAIRDARVASGLDAGAMRTFFVAHLSSASAASADGVLMPWIAIAYLIGIAATILHLSASTWGYLVRFGHVSNPPNVRRAAVASGVAGALLFGLSSITVISFASGSPVFPPSPPSAPCPTSE
jgi:succinate dehydrogenase / fumarate reductase, cytochrome b subunit